SLLRPGLHALAEAHDAAEHRDRRCCRCGPSARRLGGGDRKPHAARALPLPDRVLLDAAALLGARSVYPRQLRGSEGPDAAGRGGRPGDAPPDRRLHARADRRHAPAVRVGDARHRVCNGRTRARRYLRCAHAAPPPGAVAPPSLAALPLLPAVPRAALRRDGGGRPVTPQERELAKTNNVWGWSLLALAVVIALGTVAVAYIYDAVASY